MNQEERKYDLQKQRTDEKRLFQYQHNQDLSVNCL